MKFSFKNFINTDKDFPLLSIIIAGLYPLLYYYDKNYALINSKAQLFFFISVYIILPILIYYFLKLIITKVKALKFINAFLLTILTIAYFLILIVLTVYGFDILKMLIALAIAIVLGVVLKKYQKRIMVFQLLMVLLVLPKLIPDLYRDIVYDTDWMQQPDNIENVVFKIKPNVYVIQPDGYTNFSELKNDIYRFDNSEFENFLQENNFTLYNDFRSNYSSTLSSNSSMFAMKHHFYGNKTLGINLSQNRRNEIVGNNPVLDIFKRNGYKSFLMLQVPYLLSNRPQVDFDYCNISLDEVSYISRGFHLEKSLFQDTKNAILQHKESLNFFFIESMLPSHIATDSSVSSNDVDVERTKYLEKLKEANQWLTQLISFITENDEKALIVIASDHGGYVGLTAMDQNQTKQTDSKIIYSMFSSALAIRWPEQNVQAYNNELKSSVNLFRVLFSYLSDDESYLKKMQDDSSYLVIRKNAPFGVYQSINDKGNIVFQKLE